MADTYQYYLSSPVGVLEIINTRKELLNINFVSEKGHPSPNSLSFDIARQLEAYFAGDLKIFRIPLNPEGTTFQKKVWKALQDIPFGTTISYGALSQNIGQKKAVRAVGSANGKNPIPIIIPCHRVIGSNGSLTGYSGGLWRKKLLLQQEGITFQKELNFNT